LRSYAHHRHAGTGIFDAQTAPSEAEGESPDGARHDPVDAQQKTLNAKLRGHYQYYGRPTNYLGIGKFYRKVRHFWRTWLSRRTHGAKMTWEKYQGLLQRLLLPPRIMHSWVKTGRPA